MATPLGGWQDPTASFAERREGRQDARQARRDGRVRAKKTHYDLLAADVERLKQDQLGIADPVKEQMVGAAQTAAAQQIGAQQMAMNRQALAAGGALSGDLVAAQMGLGEQSAAAGAAAAQQIDQMDQELAAREREQILARVERERENVQENRLAALEAATAAREEIVEGVGALMGGLF